MSARSAVPNGRKILMAMGVAWVLLGCGDSTAPISTGSLEVSVATSGPQPELNNLQIVLDEQVQEPLAAGLAVITGITAGRHSVELGGVGPPCAVTTANPQTVDIQPGASVSVTFGVTCGSPATVVVSVTTTVTNATVGFSYIVVFDRTQSRSVRSTGRVVFQTVQGEHSVLLSRVPGYCLVGGFDLGPNPISVTVTTGEAKTVEFNVLCLG